MRRRARWCAVRGAQAQLGGAQQRGSISMQRLYFERVKACQPKKRSIVVVSAQSSAASFHENEKGARAVAAKIRAPDTHAPATTLVVGRSPIGRQQAPRRSAHHDDKTRHHTATRGRTPACEVKFARSAQRPPEPRPRREVAPAERDFTRQPLDNNKCEGEGLRSKRHHRRS